MFTEILRIKPVLDPAAASQMEGKLNGRFNNLTRRFGQGLRGAIKGSLLGISIGLLSRLLNPLEKMEEKIRKLLDEAKAQTDSAEDLGTTPGRLRAIQDVAGTIGVTPDTLKEMMGKYAQAIEKAKEELQDPTAKISESTQAIRQFVGFKDTAEGFLQFVQSLKDQGNSTKGADIFFGERERRKALERQISGEKLSDSEREDLKKQGLLKQLTPQETREAIEKAVFGESQRGQGKRLIDANFVKLFSNQPARTGELDQAYTNLDARDQQDKTSKINRETRDLINQSKAITPGMISAMNAAEQTKLNRELSDYEKFDELRRAAGSVENMKLGIDKIQLLILNALDAFANFERRLLNTRLFKYLYGTGPGSK